MLNGNHSKDSNISSHFFPTAGPAPLWLQWMNGFGPWALHLNKPVKRAGQQQGPWPEPVHTPTQEIQLNHKPSQSS